MEAEKRFNNEVEKLRRETHGLFDKIDKTSLPEELESLYYEMLEKVSKIAEPLDGLFRNVMVMEDNEGRKERLENIKFIKDTMDRIADFTKVRKLTPKERTLNDI